VRGLLLISHANDIAVGLKKLLVQVASDVPITYAGGLEDGSIGTSFDAIVQALDNNEAKELYAFYDLGSAKMNLEMAIELLNKSPSLRFRLLKEATLRPPIYKLGLRIQLSKQNSHSSRYEKHKHGPTWGGAVFYIQ